MASRSLRIAGIAPRPRSISFRWDPGSEDQVSDQTQATEAKRLWAEPGDVSHEKGGDTLRIIAASDRVVSAEYHRPYETHARMEPINATVSVTDERADVWSPTQNHGYSVRFVS